MPTTSLDPLSDEHCLEATPDPSSGREVPTLGLVLATDGSPAASAATQFLQLLPLPSGSGLNVVTVLPWSHRNAPQSLLGAEQVWARQTVERAAAPFRRAGISVVTDTPRGDAAHEILQAAAAFRPDLVVVGAQGHGALEQLLLGSMAAKVSKHAPCPVLIARAPRYGLKRVVLALDESEHAAQALEFAARLPLPPHCEIVVCRVVQPEYAYGGFGPDGVPSMLEVLAETRDAMKEEADAQAGAACRFLRQQGREATPIIREGDPAREILALAREQEADLVIAGARGISPIRGLLVGSVADRVQRLAECSVLLVRELRY